MIASYQSLLPQSTQKPPWLPQALYVQWVMCTAAPLIGRMDGSGAPVTTVQKLNSAMMNDRFAECRGRVGSAGLGAGASASRAKRTQPGVPPSVDALRRADYFPGLHSWGL